MNKILSGIQIVCWILIGVCIASLFITTKKLQNFQTSQEVQIDECGLSTINGVNTIGCLNDKDRISNLENKIQRLEDYLGVAEFTTPDKTIKGKTEYTKDPDKIKWMDVCENGGYHRPPPGMMMNIFNDCEKIRIKLGL